MDRDLTEVLDEWPYEPGQLSVRLIEGKDGEPRIQVRLDLGILQMCVDGRPDGRRPHGYGSLLEYYESRLDEAVLEAGGPPPEGEEAEPLRILDPADCRALREEATQYYHRYVALFVLEDFDGVVRDTTRNLRLLDLLADHARSEEDRTALEPFRAYITMMRAKARASQALKDNEPKAAIHAIDEGIDSLRGYYDSLDDPEAFSNSNEVQLLRSMREALVPKLPVSQRAELRQRLNNALAAENYELAAILRDELRLLPE